MTLSQNPTYRRNKTATDNRDRTLNAPSPIYALVRHEQLRNIMKGNSKSIRSQKEGGGEGKVKPI